MLGRRGEGRKGGVQDRVSREERGDGRGAGIN